MIVKERSFPHPVLCPFNDDVTPNVFALHLSVSVDADTYYLTFSLDYDNPTLQTLTDQAKASHCLHVECRRNFYRKTFPIPRGHHQITIPATELAGRVEVSAFIKANEALSDYSIEGAHQDYEGRSFSIQGGDVLAVAESVHFDAYVDYDPLRQVSSILTIRRSETDETGPMAVDTDSDRILVTLTQADYDRYTDLKADPAIAPVLANQVTVPVMLKAIQDVLQTPEEDREVEMSKRWFRSIAKKLDDLGFDVRDPETSPMAAMQAILQLPLRRSLQGIFTLSAEDESE